MTKRWSRVGVLVSLAALTLAGCRTNVGVAARVDGATISESTVTDHLSADGPSDEALKARAGGQQVPPARAVVLQYLIQRRVLDTELRRRGGLPSAGQLAALRRQAVSTFVGQDVSTTSLGARLAELGVKPSFAPYVVRIFETEYVLLQRVGKVVSRFKAVLASLGRSVSISPRYGNWDAAHLVVVGTGKAGLPAFLTVRRASPAPVGDPNAGG